jgi:colicin import membrane protein
MEVVYEISATGATETKAALDSIALAEQRRADLAAEVASAERAAYAEDRARTARALADKRAAIAALDAAEEAAHAEHIKRQTSAAAASAAAASREADALKRVADERARTMADARKSYEDAAHQHAMAAQSARGFGATMGSVADNVKMVGKDLDNIGLKSGKTFAMAAEGALSVVAALGTGGVAGVIGAVTIGVGYLAQAWANEAEEAKKSKEMTEKAIEAEERRWSAASRMASEYLAGQKDITIEQQKQNLVIQAAYLVELEKAIQEESDAFARGEVEKNDRLIELQALYEAESSDGRRMAEEFKLAEAEHNAEKIAKIEIEELEKGLVERLAIEKRAAEKRAEEFKRGQEQIQKEREKMDAEFDARQLAAEAARVSEQERILSARDAMRDAEEAANKKTEEEATRRNSDAIEAEYQRMRAVEATTEALEKKRAEDMRGLVAMTSVQAAQDAYAITVSNTLTPAIRGLSNAARVLGDINWETYQQYKISLQDILPLFLQRAQAELTSMAITSAGQAATKGAEAVGYFATGAGMAALGMPNANGMFAAGALAASSAAMHASFAAAHGGAALGAFGAGMVLSGAGAQGFTGADTERRDGMSQTGIPGLSRDRGGRGGRDGTGSTLTGRGSDGGGMSGAEPFVVNISYQAGSMTATDERRTARTVAHGVSRARRNAFTRRSMEG